MGYYGPCLISARDNNEVEVDDSLGRILLTQKVGQDYLWQEVKRRKKQEVEENGNRSE